MHVAQKSVFSMSLVLVAILVGGLPRIARSQQNQDSTHPVYEVWGKSSQTGEDWYFDTFHDRAKAAERIREIRHDHFDENGLLYSDPNKPTDLRIVEKPCSCGRYSRGDSRPPADSVKRGMDLLTRLNEAKEAIDHARRVIRGKASMVRANERSLADTIKEYEDMVAQSYRQVVRAKETLTGGVAALTDAKFREVNGLIDRYNREIQDYQGVMGNSASLGFSPMARVEPRTDPSTRLVGTWQGTYVQTGQEDVPATIEFNADGTVITNGGEGRGRWTLDGDTIQIAWSTGAVVTWRVSGDEITGDGTTPRGRSWSVTLRKQ
jgi:hypothetical protein